MKWPIFKWAGGETDQLFAKLAKNQINVYEAPEMGLLDKKSMRLDAVQDFEWSPTAPILCAFQTEQVRLAGFVWTGGVEWGMQLSYGMHDFQWCANAVLRGF